MAANLFSLHILIPVVGLLLLHVGMVLEILPIEFNVIASSSMIIYAGAHIPLAQSAVLDEEEVSSTIK